ncbi:HAD family hydrolase [Dactylosporangium vinaceum]|uniref:HAD family hydrolase n=1 Tax=Dactylosporangium vinaceum TaxID=53362 RepID=A0ABV5M0K2_9ACTN|nr:HAD family hydrolase [Dactylosporangium vinaceum]UAB97349.1 HAD family hydrolase [Dactylosporangium vinaceum]
MIQAVCFDYFNTCTSAVVRGEGHRRTAEILGVDPDVWLAVLDSSYPERARGGYGSLLAGLRRLCTEAGVEPTTAQLREAAAVRLAAVESDAPLRAEAVGVLRALKDAGVRIAIVSDTWVELPMILPRTPLAPLIDAAVYSSRVGHTKPHPAVYAAACDKLRVAPAHCLYIGDGGSHELTGAARFGLTAVQLRAPDLGSHLTFDAEPDWRGPAVASLTAVLDLVGTPMLVG